MTELNIEEVRKLLTWMEENKVENALITQDGSSGIGTATLVVDKSWNKLYNITNYDLW